MQLIKKFSRCALLGSVLVLIGACGAETPDRTVETVQDVAASQDIATEVTQEDTVPVVAADVILVTSLGEIGLSLDAEKAPISVANFLAYVDSGYYAGTIFHRVIPGFMVQGGGFDADYQKKSTLDPIELEASNGLKNVTYSLAMARTQVLNSATSQFYINVGDNASLDTQYAVFGKVVSGTDVVDQIAAMQTGAGGPFRSDVPVETIVIESVNRQ